MKEVNPWYFRDTFISSDELIIPWNHPTVQWGWGAFTTGRMTQGIFEAGRLHIDRILRDAQALSIPLPSKKDLLEKLERWLKELPQSQDLKIKLSLIPPHGDAVFTAYTIEPSSSHIWRLYYDPIRTLHPRPKGYGKRKTHSYADYMLLKKHAQEQGFHDALLSSEDGCIIETASCSFFFSHKGVFYFPTDEDKRILDSITRNLLTHALEKANSKIVTWQGTVDEIPTDASCYCTNCIHLITQVESIMQKSFPLNDIEKNWLSSLLQHELVSTGVAPYN